MSKNSGQLLIVEDCSCCGRTSLSLKAQQIEAKSAFPSSAIAQMVHSPGLQSQLGISPSDPFASYAVDMSTEMHGLLDHLVSVMTPTLSPVDRKYASRTNTGISYQYTISHPAVLHATLAASSMHLSVCSRDPQASIYTATRRGEAIRLVNQMLEDEQEATSDEMIGCVVRLSSYEIFTGDHNGWKAHANALKEIVRRRGGLQNWGLRGGIKRQCYESDVMGSMLGGTCPVFKPVPETLFCPDDPILPIDLAIAQWSNNSSESEALLTGSGFHGLASSGLITTPLVHVLACLCLLMLDLHAIESSTTFAPNMLLLTTKRIFADYALLSLKFTYNDIYVGPFREPVRSASLIFSNRVFRDYPPTSGVHVALVAQLKAALQVYEPAEAWTEYESILLWVCWVGGVVATTPEPRLWFERQLKLVCESIKITSWEVCRWVLNNLLWHDGRLEEAGHNFWEAASKT